MVQAGSLPSPPPVIGRTWLITGHTLGFLFPTGCTSGSCLLGSVPEQLTTPQLTKPEGPAGQKLQCFHRPGMETMARGDARLYSPEQCLEAQPHPSPGEKAIQR